MNNLRFKIAKVVLLWLFSCSIIIKAFGQTDPEPDWIRIGFNLSPQMNFSKFSESTVMHGSLRIVPMPLFAFGISASIDIHKRWALETNLNYSVMGTKTKFNANYPGNNIFEGVSDSRTTHSVLSIPICLKYNSLINSRRSKKYIKLGTNLLINPVFSGGFIASSSSTMDRYTKSLITQDISWAETPFVMPTLMVGIGTEKHISRGRFISFGINFTQGFKRLENWDFTLTYAGNKYDNKIANKGTYFGFEIKYFLSPLGYKSYKRALEKFKENND